MSDSNGQDGPDAPRDREEIRRHEAHLVGQIYHLIETNRKLEEQLERLSGVTEIADIFRRRKISVDTFELSEPRLAVPADVLRAWDRVGEILDRMPADTPGLQELRESLGIVRGARSEVDPDWLADVRLRLLAAEQAIAFLDEQSKELDDLREEKNSIVDGVGRLEQTNEDLWKSLNEKTTHIQRLESQLGRIWNSTPYRIFSTLRRPFRRKEETS